MNILIIRFSAVGDLVISFPYLLELLEQKPDHHIYLATKGQMRRFVPAHPRLHPIFLEKDEQKKGLLALVKYYITLKKINFDCVVDLHNNLRSNLLINLFRLAKVKTFQLDKNRQSKKAITRSENKIRTQLPYIGTVYKNLLEKGSQSKLDDYPTVDISSAYPNTSKKPFLQIEGKIIGIAPFAAHQLKVYPLELMEKVVENLYANSNTTIAFFCFGKEEEDVVKKWSKNHKERTLYSFELKSFSEEMTIIQQLDLMLTMDSANLHFATLAGTPTLSIWGPTDPLLGFAPQNKLKNHCLSMPFSELSCRPCSVFGNKKCINAEEHACMKRINPESITEKIMNLF